MVNSTRATTKQITHDNIRLDLYLDNVGVSIVSFGADPTGVADSTDAIQAAFDYALANNLKVVQNSGRFRITKSIPFSNEQVDFTGSTLVMEGQSQFVYSQKEAPITYDASNEATYGVLGLINSSTALTRSAGSSKLSGLENSTILNDHYIIIKASSQQMFRYRDDDEIQTRKDFNRVYSRGRLEEPHYYNLPNTVDSVYALPIKRELSNLVGFSFDLSLSTRYHVLDLKDASRLRLKGWSIDNKPLTPPGTFFSFIEQERTYDVEIEDLDDPYAYRTVDGGVIKSSYTLAAYECMNLRHINCIADGDGWGTTGNNDCQNVTYEGCTLSRVDFHKPYRGYLKVIDCKLGRDGILVTGYGDLIVHNTTFAFKTDGSLTGGIIQTRPDAGGFVDGDLIMTNCKLVGNFDTVQSNNFFIHGRSDGPERGPYPTSPVKRTLFNSITIRNLSASTAAATAKFSQFIGVNMDGAVMFPTKITLENIDLNTLKSTGIGLRISTYLFMAAAGTSLTDTSPTLTNRHTSAITMKNVNVPLLTIFGSGTAGRHNLLVNIDGLRNDNYGETPTLFEAQQKGTYYLSNSDIEAIDTVYGTTPVGPVNIQMTGGRILVGSTSDLPIQGFPSTSNINLVGVDIVAPFAADSGFLIARNLAQYSSLKSCNFYEKTTGTKINGAVLYNTNGVSVSPSLFIKAGNKLKVANGYDGNSTYTLNETHVPVSSSKSYVPLGGSNATTLVWAGNAALGGSTLNTIASPSGLEFVGLMLS